MSVYPCSVCGQRVVGRLCSVYHAWFNADGGRVAYKQRLCVQDLIAQMKPMLIAAAENSADLIRCPSCGSDSSDDLDPIYSTVYLPKQEPKEYQLTTCGSCAAKARILMIRGAEKLPDRGGDSLNNNGGASDWGGVLP